MQPLPLSLCKAFHQPSAPRKIILCLPAGPSPSFSSRHLQPLIYSLFLWISLFWTYDINKIMYKWNGNKYSVWLFVFSLNFIYQEKKKLKVSSWMPKKWCGEGGRGLLWLDDPPLVFWLCHRFLHLLAACTRFGKWSSCGWNSAMLFPQLLCRIVTLFSPPCLLLLTIWPHFGSPVLWWEGSWTVHCPEWRRVTQKVLADNHSQA